MKRLLRIPGLVPEQQAETTTANQSQSSSTPPSLTIQDLIRADFCEREIAHLITLQRAYITGSLSEETSETQRLAFARWLYSHNYIRR